MNDRTGESFLQLTFIVFWSYHLGELWPKKIVVHFFFFFFFFVSVVVSPTVLVMWNLLTDIFSVLIEPRPFEFPFR